MPDPLRVFQRALHNAIDSDKTGTLDKIFIREKNVGTYADPNFPLITDETFRRVLGPSWKEKVKAWGEDQQTILEYVKHQADNKKSKTVAFA